MNTQFKEPNFPELNWGKAGLVIEVLQIEKFADDCKILLEQGYNSDFIIKGLTIINKRLDEICKINKTLHLKVLK